MWFSDGSVETPDLETSTRLLYSDANWLLLLSLGSGTLDPVHRLTVRFYVDYFSYSGSHDPLCVNKGWGTNPPAGVIQNP
jgi:hypothetical protein